MSRAKGTKSDHEIDLTFYIAFGEVDVMKGANAVEYLRDIAAKVVPIIDETEVEARRLSLVT